MRHINPVLMKDYLDEQVSLINTHSFIASDPVQFPRRYGRKEDIEVVSLVISLISWGQRKSILKDAERLLGKMGDSPYHYIMNGEYEGLGNGNVHRTFFEADLAYILRGFRYIFEKWESVEEYLAERIPDGDGANVWRIVEELRAVVCLANGNEYNSKCFPANFGKSALKRYNLALRWLVRNDGIVDLGIWRILKPSQLYIPLDVHVGNTARGLGLLGRNSNDRRAVEELTLVLRSYCPEDPVKYDFALFGIGVGGREL